MDDVEIEALRVRGRLAARQLMVMLSNDADRLIDLAIRRASTVGVAEYGGSSYRKTREALAQDVAEELADAIFYQHILVGRRQESPNP